MKKLLFQFTILAVVFAGAWYALSQLPWSKWLHASSFNKKRQEKLGELFIKTHRLDKKEITNDSVASIMNSLKNNICMANHIDTGSIKVYVFRDEQVNAFALPGGSIVVNSALISFCDSPDMLAGVIAHEIGHIQNGHISKRMAKEVGLSILMMFGGDNMGLLKELLRSVTSGKFDRSQESEADQSAVYYLDKTNINPAPLADFFEKMGKTYGNMPGMLEWVSTHPNAKERTSMVRKLAKKKTYRPALPVGEWTYLHSYNY